MLLQAWPEAGSAPRHGEVEEPGRVGQVEGGQDGLLAGGGERALGDPAVAGGEGDQVAAVEFEADVAPGVADGVLDDPDQQQRELAQLAAGADPVLPVVEHRAQP